MLKSLTGIILIFFLNSAMSASTLDFQLNHNQQTSQQITYIDDGKLLVKAIGGDTGQDLLFEQENSTLTLINHQTRTYSQFSESVIANFASQAQGLVSILESQMENLPEEEANQLRALLGISDDEQTNVLEPLTLKAVGTRTIAGYPCQHIEAYKNTTQVAVVCVSDPSVLKIPPEDFSVLRSMQKTAETIARTAGAILEKFGATIPNYGYNQLDGMPIEIVNMEQTIPSSLTLVSIANGAPEALGVPQGYTLRVVPGF